MAGSPHRLFIGIEIPKTVRDEVAEAFAPVREAFPTAKWVLPQNLHVTLRFLGPVWPRLVARVQTACEGAVADVPPFDLRLSGVGSFPKGRPQRRKAAVLWAGLFDPDDGCGRLVSRLRTQLEPEFPPESHPFAAHLTVARSRPPVELGEALASVSVASQTWTVSEIVVFESHLRRPAPRYEALARLPLADA